ncbi:MAG TPA: S9 family peptidase [Ktedonobacteraceae bacterium]|nr:S9 family peptidase [Ktedonobacteraceae bacterium]
MTTNYPFERYLNVRNAYGATFSPDGQRLSFLTDITGVAEVWSVTVGQPGGQAMWPEQLTFRGERVSGVTYSPVDPVMLIAADSGGSELDQFYTLSQDGSEFTALTDRPEVMYRAGIWSPDGQRIAYASNERDPRYFDIYERDMGNGTIRLLWQQDSTNFPVSYAPDGTQVIVQRLYSNIFTQLFLLDTTSGEARALTPDTAQGPSEFINPSWSADGTGLYVICNRGRDFLSLAWLDLASGELTYLRDDGWDIESLALTHDGRHMALLLNEDGYSRLELFDVSQGWRERRELASPELKRGVVNDMAWSHDGKRLAITRLSASAPMDIWLWDSEQETFWQVTRSSSGGIPQERFIEPTLIHYPTFDERQIPAFLFLPNDKPARDLPVVINVHGGPEGQARPIFNAVNQFLVAQGYAVLAPNVRGSSGYGYTYMSLDDVRKRMDSVADLQSAVLWLRESGIADPRRIVVMGGSYGGFMVLSAITTYPDLWAAAVDIVGIANFVSFLENTHPWRRKLRECEYGSLENDREFLEEISPIRRVDQVRAPLFVIHGANDPRVPVGEAEQIVAALRQRQVPVEYLRFEDEGHGLIKRANRLVAYPAVVRFLDKYLK